MSYRMLRVWLAVVYLAIGSMVGYFGLPVARCMKKSQPCASQAEITAAAERMVLSQGLSAYVNLSG